MKNTIYKHITSFSLPIAAIIIIPTILLQLTKKIHNWLGVNILSVNFQIPAGFIFILSGFYLLISTIKLFATIGKGTLAPWAPPQRLVVVGIYRYTRNPMLSGVLSIILGEIILTGAGIIFVWGVLFFLANTFYFIISEEPSLEKRFGGEYVKYKKNVPRWIPKLKAWHEQEK